MPFAAALSTAPEAARAVEEVCSAAGAALGGTPDLAVLFFSAHHATSADDLARGVRERLQPRRLLGCVAEAVIGTARGGGGGRGVRLWLARGWRPVPAEPFHLVLERTADGPSLFGLPDALLGVAEGQKGRDA